MTTKKESFDEMNIVPERDEMHSHGGRSRSRSRRGSSDASPDEVSVKTGGGVKFLLTLLLLGMIATGAAGYFFYMQGQTALNTLSKAEGRIAQLENRLSMVGEAAEQTSMGFLERVDTNFSEIDKLWAARNQNVKEITANKTSLDGQAKTLSAAEKALSSQAGTLNQSQKKIKDIESTLTSVTSSFADVESFAGQLDRLNVNVNSLQEDVANRMNTAEQDIESINVSRLQINQRLNALQDGLNSLQQRVGQ